MISFTHDLLFGSDRFLNKDSFHCKIGPKSYGKHAVCHKIAKRKSPNFLMDSMISVYSSIVASSMRIQLIILLKI